MKPNRHEQAALAKVIAADQEERHRGELWAIFSRVDRVRALGVSGIDTKRAMDPLSSFTPAERAQIYGFLSSHVAKMECILKLMGVTMFPGVLDRAKAH